MSIKLDWAGGSTDIDGYYVYRSETPMDPLAPPTPFATLPKTTKTWTDTNTPRGKLFYYRVSAYKGSEQAVTLQRAMAYVPYTGPGEPEIVSGDWEAGFFGEMPFDDLAGFAMLNAWSGGTLLSYTVKPTLWLKMAYKGKVLFIPNFPAGTSTFSALYANGCVYGDLDPSLIAPYIKTALGEPVKAKKVVIGEDEFILRTPRSRKDPLSTSNANLDRGGNEIDLIYAKLFLTRSITEFDVNKGFRSYAALGSATYTYLSSDYNNGVNILTRVFGGGTYVDGLGSAATSATSYWLPVLELVL